MAHHVFRSQAANIQQHPLRGYELAEAMIAALQHWASILEQVPEEWWYLDEDLIIQVDFDSGAIRQGLAQANRDEFWGWQ